MMVSVLMPVPESPCGEHLLVPSDVAGWVVSCAVCGRYWRRAQCSDSPRRRDADDLVARVRRAHPELDLDDPERVAAIAALAETLRALLLRDVTEPGRARWRRLLRR